VVDLSKDNFRNPSVSGELQASRLPRHPWLKIPRQILTSQNTPTAAFFAIFYHFSPTPTLIIYALHLML
jgi:hypothetical protein